MNLFVNIVVLFHFVLVIQYACSYSEKLLLDLNERFDGMRQANQHIWQSPSYKQGHVLCTGQHSVADVLRVIYELRMVWRSTIPIAVMHCEELDAARQQMIRAMDGYNNTVIIDICNDKSSVEKIFSIPGSNKLRKRLRGFYCKIAAAVVAPFEEFIVQDNDVVWLQHPQKLFQSQRYLSNGMLFFRDRVMMHKGDDLTKHFQARLKQMHPGLELTHDYVQKQYLAHGMLQVWRCFPEFSAPNASASAAHCSNEEQDSSVIVIDALRQQPFLNLLAKSWSTMDFGYGDKELWWLLALQQGANFSFEANYAAQFGDCSGFVMHYHPDHNASEPFYVNAEYLVEDIDRLGNVGQFLGHAMTAPMLMTAEGALPHHNHCYLRPYRSSNCTCGKYPCIPIPEHVQQRVLFSQWITMSLRINRDVAPTKATPYCITMYVAYASLLDKVFSSETFDRADCRVLGCPYLPLQLNDSLVWLPGVGRICDPVYFSQQPPEGFQALAAKYRKPLSPVNTPQFTASPTPLVLCQPLPTVYMLGKNRTFQRFHSFKQYVDMGFDNAMVTHLTHKQCEHLQFGPPLDP